MQFDKEIAGRYSDKIAAAIAGEIGSDNDFEILRSVLYAWITEMNFGSLPETAFSAEYLEIIRARRFFCCGPEAHA